MSLITSSITAVARPARGIIAAATASQLPFISTRRSSSSVRPNRTLPLTPLAAAGKITSSALVQQQRLRQPLLKTSSPSVPHRNFTSTTADMAASGTSSGHPITILTADLAPKLPSHSTLLFAAKKAHNLSFETIGAALGRDEIAAAALFYGQARATPEDVEKLSSLLQIPLETLQATEITGIPDRGRSMEMPPKEPLMYRLYEIVQNYGYAYKAVINEKFGDGIMSAISYSTKVEREVDDKGEWVKITLRGKWLSYTRF